ncbi:hypothetical protein [Streptosporangium roseum]|uniref:hypothetical protein n=1 Tax=Streptosporangium roseum TaxID=2001 RepID=UPI0004CD6E11|nr:hypothetical protein [Streptosporangium roseum]
MTDPDDYDCLTDLADEEFNALLAAADADLLTYVEANTDPTAVLITFFDPPEPVPIRTFLEPLPLVPLSVAGASAAALLSARLHLDDLEHQLISAHELAHALTHALDLAHGFLRARVRGLARDLDRDLALALDRARNLAHDDAIVRTFTLVRDLDLDLELGPIRDLVRDLIRELDHDLDIDRVRVRVRNLDLTFALDLARTLNRFVDVFPLDVSGTDLSHLNLTNLSRLSGVVWSDSTTWPLDIAEQVRAGSREVGPGVYQVQDGNEHAKARR